MNVPVSLRAAALVLAASVLGSTGSGCFGGSEAPPRPGERAKGRPGDPPLSHTWQMPADKSVLQSADLGSLPPALAEALMADGAAPGISHRISTRCAGEGALEGVATVALRVSIDEAGAVTSLEGDPAGKAATCIGDAFREELAERRGLPAGAALLVLRFHASAPTAR